MDILSQSRRAIIDSYLLDEATATRELLNSLKDYDPWKIKASARALVTSLRENHPQHTISAAFLQEYKLNNQEGIILMAMAEALLRIPDHDTQDRLIQEKLTSADWREHLQHSPSLLVNLTTQALALTGRIEQQFQHSESGWHNVYGDLLARLGQPIIRSAIMQAMQQLAYQFVMAETIEAALKQTQNNPNYIYAYDMLGEAALTAGDARRYFDRYSLAIEVLASASKPEKLCNSPNISVKLSALCPYYKPTQHRRAVKMLSEKLLILSRQASQAGISLTIDAEESERMDMSLQIFETVFVHPDLQHWHGLGLAVQAYQKRAFTVLQWLAELASQQQKIIPLRLVKGAYWDSEIKQAQEAGLSDYPVFTHKSATDISYLACAQFILAYPKAFYPQFASHNAHTLAAVHEFGRSHLAYEFQRLFGMGEQLYDEIIDNQNWQTPCRIYAPIGRYRELLPYLVRRLLENGANSSFISQLDDPDISIEQATADPVEYYQQGVCDKPGIPLPVDIYGEQRKNSSGVNVNDITVLQKFQQQLDRLADRYWQARPLVAGMTISGDERRIVNPADQNQTVGDVINASKGQILTALKIADAASNKWRQSKPEQRVALLLKCADSLEQKHLELVSLVIREGGRTIIDALNEVREAVDFCRYYSQCLSNDLAKPIDLPGPTGELNELHRFGRGIFVCISPWNFPLAIFIGQISAALAAGNCVIAKPSSQTPLTAMLCIQLMHQAGVPKDVLQFLPAEGKAISQYLLSDYRIAGVAFTGSTATAHMINRQLAQEHEDIIPLIAETGGQNVMIVDSSALQEQVVNDAVYSAFNSAGQRCSALRVIFVQQDIAERIIKLLIGAMQELVVGDPGCYANDIGPLIDQVAVQQVTGHIERMTETAKLHYQLKPGCNLENGNYLTPCLIEIESLSQLKHEVFGPVLHLIRYPASTLDQVIVDINATGYGLTLGIHSRLQSTIDQIQQQVRVGNIYINRNMIGAVVGAQPFGGMGLSGTGPKAGGPFYLHRFSCEQTVSCNTTASGGNASLMARDLR